MPGREPTGARLTPTIRAIVASALADGLSLAETLAAVQAHARRYQNALTFDDAVELARLAEAGGER